MVQIWIWILWFQRTCSVLIRRVFWCIKRRSWWNNECLRVRLVRRRPHIGRRREHRRRRRRRRCLFERNSDTDPIFWWPPERIFGRRRSPICINWRSRIGRYSNGSLLAYGLIHTFEIGLRRRYVIWVSLIEVNWLVDVTIGIPPKLFDFRWHKYYSGNWQYR